MGKNKVKKVDDLLDVLKIRQVLSRYTDINPTGGFYHRFNKSGNTLRKEEKEAFRDAVIELSEDLKKVADKI